MSAVVRQSKSQRMRMMRAEKPISPRTPWIVCIGGEDWWYHSHAHFDIQVMKRLARRCRVLYICSIGMRMPSVRRDAQFWRRIRNKLASVSRTVQQVDTRLYVYSPMPLPLYQWRWGRGLNQALLAAQLRAVFAHLAISRPLLWVNTPTGWPVVRSMGKCGLVYQRTDEYAELNFDNFNRDYVRAVDAELLSAADLVLHVDPDLHARTANRTKRALLLEQGVDERFFEPPRRRPEDLVQDSRPVVGYVGNLEPHKFDAELVCKTASLLPDCRFVIVGPYHQNADSLRELPNVSFLGSRPHEQISDYVKAFDVCMLPTARTQWGLHCKPIKLMEYLAAGRPVVATRVPAAEHFDGLLHVSDNAESWASAIRSAVAHDDGQRSERARRRLSKCTWNHLVERIWSELAECGLLTRDDTNPCRGRSAPAQEILK